jgi:hypothetical protein
MTACHIDFQSKLATSEPPLLKFKIMLYLTRQWDPQRKMKNEKAAHILFISLIVL